MHLPKVWVLPIQRKMQEKTSRGDMSTAYSLCEPKKHATKDTLGGVKGMELKGSAGLELGVPTITRNIQALMKRLIVQKLK